MNQYRWMMIGLAVAAGVILACGGQSAAAASKRPAPAKVEKIEGSSVGRVIVTGKGAERLGIETSPVRESQVARRGAPGADLRKVVPYSAVIYDAKGETWAYTNPETLTFVRQRIVIDYISGGMAVLSDGPGVGTLVVTVGAAELFGTETGVGK